MAVAVWPNNKGTSVARCDECGRDISLGLATVSSAFQSGQPAIACETHRADRIAWIAYWTAFRWQQRLLGERIQRQAPPAERVRFVEQRTASDPFSLKSDVAWHLATRSVAGQSIIVTERPIAFYSTLRKQWKKIGRRVQLSGAATLGANRSALADALRDFNTLTFSSTVRRHEADVLVLAPDELKSVLPGCLTLYLCTYMAYESIAAVVTQLPHNALIVDYGHIGPRLSASGLLGALR